MIGKIVDNSNLTANSIFNIKTRLNNTIAYKMMAPNTWTFYETVESILGPYGDKGFPLFSGKFFTMALNTNTKLQQNTVSSAWIKNSTIKIQEKISESIIESLSKNKTGKISDVELRSIGNKAFNSVYDDQGIKMIVAIAPEILPLFQTLPGRASLGYSHYFKELVSETFCMLETFIPSMIQQFTSGTDLPEFKSDIRMYSNRYKGLYTDSFELQKMTNQLCTNLSLGILDHPDLLNFLYDTLRFNHYIDQDQARLSQKIILNIQSRISFIDTFYKPLRLLRPNMDL